MFCWAFPETLRFMRVDTSTALSAVAIIVIAELLVSSICWLVAVKVTNTGGGPEEPPHPQRRRINRTNEMRIEWSRTDPNRRFLSFLCACKSVANLDEATTLKRSHPPQEQSSRYSFQSTQNNGVPLIGLDVAPTIYP